MSRKSGESGIALLLAIFTLLLLAALALAMLGAADLETTIAANYRDKQTSIYGSLSGLQEVRDRLIASRCDAPIGSNCNDAIAIDTRGLDVPSTSSANVIYIINPSGGETVAPWDPTSKYFDNQLCHDMGPTGHSLLNVTNYTGVCKPDYTSVPSGTSWYVRPQGSHASYDDSNSAAGEYYASSSTFPKPLTYKWVRVTLKTNNMTPARVLGPGTDLDASPMCWDGSNQIPATPGNGLKNDCTALGTITLFNGTNTCTSCGFSPPIGSGYDDHGTGYVPVTISGGGGSGATATAHVTNTGAGSISSINFTPGSGYTSAPLVVITGVGTGATATATIQKPGAPVASFSSVTQTSPVGCYASAFPSIALTGGGGTGASATAVMSGKTCIAGWTVGVSGTCSAYANQTVNVGANGGGGAGFAGRVTFKNNGKSITSYSITNPGGGYNTTPTSISGLSGCTLTATWTLGYQLNSVSLVNPGSGYTSSPTVVITAPTAPAGSASPSVTANLGAAATNAGQITGVTVTNGGTGYTTPPTITFSGGGGTGATASPNMSTTGKIDLVTLTSPGSGYTSAPVVSFGGGGTGADAYVTAKLAAKQTLGRVYTLTALAVTPSGSRTMTQMEVATHKRLPVTLPGALTIDAFSPNVNPGTSNNYIVNGKDANSCGEHALDPKASVGVIDNPNAPTNPTAVSCLTSLLGGAPNPLCPVDSGVKSTNYIGSKASPDVENVYDSLGDLTTPQGADFLATELMSVIPSTQHFTGTQTGSSVVSAGGTLGNISTNQCPGLYINGDFTIGPVTGCGILLVTGNLTMQGDYAWYGPVFVIGAGGSFTGGGGGHGIINGSLFVAQTRDSTQPLGSDGQYPLRSVLGTPTVSFQLLGGGGNGIAYDHCWVDNLLGSLNLLMPPSNQPLKVLSVRHIY